MPCLYYADNTLTDDDRFYKVQPIVQPLNEPMKMNKADEFLSVDQIMVLYFGRYSDKQYMKGKPVRFGYKLWEADISDGTLFHCGSNTKTPVIGWGMDLMLSWE